MKKKELLTKVLAVVGTVLAWFPILAPVVLAVIGSIAMHRFLFDYLMPAELFPFALAGGLLLLWAALRARAYRAIIGLGLGVAIVMFTGCLVIPEVTGLASGKIEPAGWPWVLVLVLLGAYWLALVVIGIGGVLLVRELFKAALPSAENV